MKKILIQFLVLIITLFVMIGCSKDLGNYDYQDINELEIGGVLPSYSALTGQPIKIIPEFAFTLDKEGKEDNYSYEWISFDDKISIETNKRRLISTSRNLDTVLTLPSSDYTFYYRVTEKSTGVQWRKKFKVYVTSNINSGWLVLNDISGKARLDMLSYQQETNDFYHYNDILDATSSGIQLNGKPVMVSYVYNRDVFTSQFTARIYVGTDSITYSINNQVFTWSNNRPLNIEVMRPVPDRFHAKKILSMGSSALSYLIDSEGILGAENLTQNVMYGTTLNRLNTGGKLNISMHVAEQYRANSSYLVMFEEENRRFLVHSGTNQVALVPSSDSEIFVPGNMDKDLRYLEFTPALSGHYFSVMKDKDSNKHYVLRFTRSATSVFSLLVYDEIINAPDIAIAERFAVDPIEAYLFYQVGSKVYQYDPFSKTTKLMLDLGNRKISLMKYHKSVSAHTNERYIENSRKLMVCSYDDVNPNTSGKMELYNVPNFNQALTLFQSYDGFGKIVDVSYRE